MVQSLNFVQDYPRVKKDSLNTKQKTASLSGKYLIILI
jgi:hypothetical protein